MLARIKEVTLDAYNNQDLPFEKLVEEIQPERNLSHNPLFQVWFALNNSPMPSLEIGGLTLTISEADSATAQFDLSLDMVEQQDELIGTFEYSSDLFDADTITRIAAHFQTLLVGIIANPEQQIATLPLLTKAEENNLLWKWNNNQVEYPPNQCIHQLFENANKIPNSVSVVFQQQRLTYQELNSKANQLAHYLRSLGVKKNVLVGICVERSVEMIVALLGVLKAGGAYVPLDPAYPNERLSFMLHDSQVSVLLTQQILVSSLPVENVPVVCLDTDWEIISQHSEINPANNSTPDDLAYVIYTSGSTGKSKGVAIAHRSLVNAFYAWEKAYQLDTLTSHLQMASFAFDVFSGDLIRALCSGAKLVLCPREWLLEAEKLYQLMLEEKVDSAEFVPVVLKNLVQYLEKTRQNLHFMRLLVVGSDSLYINEYQEFQRFCGEQTRLINSYGVTEATIDSTYFEATKLNLSGNGLVPIGRPFANTEIYILDSSLQPVPIGIAGELYIGGVGLAQNYLNRPDLTKEKFILWNGEKRLYKTGDKAKYLADGNIEFLGRLDYQIKLRGFRIELGEIEAVIKQHPCVDEAVVIAREDIAGDRRLVAYFVEKSQFDKTNNQQLPAPINTDLQENQQRQLASDLREFLEQKLPDYMIPAAFLRLEALPITPNGKLDRLALPAPEATQLLSESDFIAPSTPIEQTLVKIWTEVLGIENIGIHHNFFSLGGHSLLATRLLSQIRQVFQIELPLRRIFEKPTIAGLAKDIEKAPKADLIEATSIERIARSQKLPLSFAQQRFWFLAQLELHSSSYNMPGAVRLLGQLNVEALQQSFNEIIARHEALRTNFPTIEGQPVAVILPPLPVELPIFDISELPANQQELQVKQQALAEAQQPFDLNEGFLLRVKLLRLGAQEHVILLTMHHIASDAWSTDILVREFATLYQAFCDGQPAPLAELPIQYVDFAAWQRQWLQGQRLETQISYWRKQLEGVPKLLELPTDFPRPPVQTFRGATYAFELPQQLSVALNQLSQQQGTTLFMTLLAAFQTLLYRYTGSEDIAIGSPIGNRNQTELDGLIGLFVNTLVLRTNLAGNPTFEQLLTNVRSVALSAYAHQDLPFEVLVEELQPQRNLSYTPLFQIMFVLQNAPMSALELPGLTLTYLPIDSGTAKFDLTLDMTETAEGLYGAFEYNTDLFEASTIERMAEHLQTLLAAIVANPQQRLSQLPLLTPLQQHQLLQQWNNTQVTYPTEQCLHELFVAQVERTPDAVAVVYENQQLTYSELNAKANQLAHYLRSLGVKPETLVGICVDRSLDVVTCLLAILKAGGAYVPLDPAYPQERLAFMLQDAQVSVLITQQHLLENFSANQVNIVCLDTHYQNIAAQSSQNPISQSTTDNLAYIIYTSGSTGQPKGVLVNHSHVVRLFAATESWYNFNQQDVWTLFHSIAFDFSVWEIWGALLHGGRLVVVPYWVSRSPTDFYELLVTQQVTILNQTPSAFRQLIQVEESLENNNINNLSLRKVIFGGEALQIESLRPWFERHGDCSPQLINMYGITETTVHVTYRPLTMADLQVTSKSLIGRPIPDLQVYVLDSYQQPVPIGVPGEMYVGGAGVVRGYLNRPELTLERFISNTFDDSKFNRLYKTGDLARYLANGEIEYLGRIDHQVKIRGFRIELGEIEALISQYPGVRETVVIVRDSSADSQRIVAYVVPSIEQPLVSQLRSFLESKLPNYMIPAAFVTLEALPLTLNGKIDRQALPVPESTQILPSADIIPASTPIENLLAGIWAEVLGIDKVGIYNNFFELGGHSLIATRVISQIRQVFQIELPLRCLFERPIIAELAKEIASAIDVNAKIAATNIEQIARSPKLPLSFAQQRLWFLAQLEPNSAYYNISAAVRLHGQLNVEALQQSFTEIIARHEALRTNFLTIEGQAIAVINAATPLTLPIIDISELPTHQLEAEVKQQTLQEAQKPFDLKQDLLLRVKLLRLGAQEHVVLLTMHHIVSDGWSTGVLVREFATLYQAFCNRQALPLPPLPIQYADFAAWQRQWLQGEVLETQMSYWRKQLEDAPRVLELPTDYPRPAIQTFRGATYSFNLSNQLSLALNKLSQQQGTTLFMTLLAAFQTLLYRYTGSEDMVIGSPIANRNQAEIEGLIGVFVNTLVLRTNLAGNPTFSELLKRVREVALGAYAHQDLPFELLVEELQPERDLSHTPLFQTMFVLQNAPMSALELPNLTLSLLESDSATAQFDLTLDMTETESGLIGSLEYNTDLFQESTIERMAGHLQTLLEAIVANPQQRLSQLPLLTASEQHQLLRQWNNTEVVYPANQCIHELFEQQVERTPNAVAVVYENQQLTYRELNAKANQLADYLRSQGVSKNVLVGIIVDRSVEMIVGLWGVLKAGGAYVPLDPAYPQERIADIFADTKLGFVLTQERFLDKLLGYSGKTICLDTDWAVIDTHSTANPISSFHSHNLAYIIYTSGSTGKPKGVAIEHRSVMNFVITAIDEYGINASDKVLQFASICFDTSIEEIFTCLCVGATLVLRTEEMLSSADFWLCCQKWQLTVLDLPTAYWHQLVAELNPQDSRIPEGLRTVIIGGEEVQLEKVQHWHSSAAHLSPAPQLFNSYGPTEATVVTTLECLTPAATSVSIGRPISNAQVYVLDKYLQPLPIGVPGELHIGGAGLARGYWQRPELTAEKFIENPIADASCTRLYKTGDLVRFRTDGNLEYLGRIDNQVKIRGFRIELSEIEAVLRQHPQVSQAVAIAHEDTPGQKRLVAYVVPQASPPIIDELRDFLKQKLPNYMIPGVFMVLESIPMTSNRKVDYRALPTPGFSRSSEDKFIAPRTLIEEKLVAIWSEVLRVENVGIHDNFFELGGDSILSLQVISKANQAGLHFTPKQVFQYQTIAQLATVTNTNTPILAEQGLVTGSFPLTPIQHWFFEENANNHYNQAVLLEVQQTIDPVLLEQVIHFLLQHHDLLRSQFVQESSGWQARITEFEHLAPITDIDLSTVPPESQSTAITATCSELQTSLNLFSGKLLQVALFNLGVNQRSRLFIVIHHLVVDGVSWRILLADLQTAYAQLSRGETIKLSPKTTSFKQWAYQLQQYAQSPAVQAEMDYWVQILRQSCSFLPVDYPAGDNTVSSAASVTVTLSAEETRALLQDVPAAYRTQINDALLLALAQVFAQWTGQTKFLLDLEGHGREEIFSDIDISRTIGWFTTVFPIVLSAEETSNIGETLKMVKEQIRQIPNRGIGYGLLRYLSSDRSIITQLQQLPQAQVIFNYLGQIDQVLSESSLFKPATESSGSESSLQENRHYLLEVDAIVVASQLQINWKYSQNIHQTSTIENLAQNFVEVLRNLIAHCHEVTALLSSGGSFPNPRSQSLKAIAYTPSDFPLAKLDWQTLNRLVNRKPQIEDIYPLSPVQYGMLFHLLYDAKSSAYLYQTSCTLHGDLNVWAFEQAWNQVIERHPILRTAFVWEIDTPMQVVLPQVNFCLQHQDWQHLATSEQQSHLEEFLQADLAQGFDLDEAPLMRLTLIQLGLDTYHLIWSCHHILLDGWSVPLLLKEVFGFYKALCSNQQMQLPISCPYRDYIAWLQQQNLRSAQAYWQQTLAGVFTPTPLPLQQSSQKLPSAENNFYEQDIQLSQATTNALASFTRQYKLTLNTLMQGVWALLLGHYSGEPDIVFGATVSGRPPSLTTAESMIGLFINTIPVRVKLAKEDLFLPWLTQIQHSQVEARQYEYSPLVKIQEWSQIPRGLPLFNSIVVFQNYPVDAASENIGLEIKNVRSWSRNHYPLTVRVVPGAELSVQILWMSETTYQRVNAGAIARITRHLKILLSEISKNPHLSIQELLEMLTEIDLQQQLLQKSELQATERQKLKMTKRKAIRDI